MTSATLASKIPADILNQIGFEEKTTEAVRVLVNTSKLTTKELQEKLGVSQPTINRIVKDLVVQSIVIETVRYDGQKGRPQHWLTLNLDGLCKMLQDRANKLRWTVTEIEKILGSFPAIPSSAPEETPETPIVITPPSVSVNAHKQTGFKDKLIRLLDDGSELSRTELQEKLGCSAPTISIITRDLVSKGLIVKTSRKSPNQSRQQDCFSLRAMNVGQEKNKGVTNPAPRPKFDPSQLKGRPLIKRGHPRKSWRTDQSGSTEDE